MATRRLNIQPLTSYDQQVQNFLGRLRLYRVWRVNADPRAIQQGTLYKSQLDGLKTINGQFVRREPPADPHNQEHQGQLQPDLLHSGDRCIRPVWGGYVAAGATPSTY